MKVFNHIGFNSYWGTHLPANVLDLESGPTVGGGEEAGIRTAVGLRELGHDVVTYWYGRSGVWRGLEFRSLDEDLYGPLVGEKWDVVLGWSSLRALEWAPKTSRKIYCQQLNDLFFPGGWDRVNCIVSPSRSHAEQLSTWGWNKRPIAVVHNGLDIDQYQNAPAWDSRPMDVGYWSSPDRGLHHLLAAWPHVTKVIPSARLHVFYEINRYLEGATTSPGIYCERAQILKLELVKAKLDSSIIFHGAVPRKKLAPIQKQCRVMCYPYEPVHYCEGFCGSLNGGIAAGCLVMTTKRDALPSLYTDTVHWLNEDPKTGGCSMMDAGYPKWLANQVVLGLRGDIPDQDAIRARAAKSADKFTWDKAALEMERACKGEGWFTL